MVKNITIFTTKTCAYCPMVKKYLTAKGLQYDEVNLSILDSGSNWALWVEGRGGDARFGDEVSPGALDYNISAGSLDGTAIVSYSIPPTAAQNSYPGEGSATCSLDSA